MSPQPPVRATAFESRQVYRSHQRPGYTSWISFFPGERGRWYLTCEEVTRPEKPLPQCAPQQWYSMGLPAGYDKSQYLMEAVILESADDMRTWKVISRQPFRHHHTVGQFGTTRTPDGRFLRFAWSCYSLDDSVTPCEILYVSDDDGRTWQRNRDGELMIISDWNTTFSYVNEPTVAEVEPGRLLMFMRTGLGRIFQAWSSDGGETWTRPWQLLQPPLRSAPCPPVICWPSGTRREKRR